MLTTKARFPLPGDGRPPEPPIERLERLADVRYVRVDLTDDRHAHGVVVNSNPFTRELLVEWWNPFLWRVQADVFVLDRLHPLGELRDALTYTGARGEVRRGFVICVDGDMAVLECWQPGGRWPLNVRVPMVQVQPYTRLLAGYGD